MYITFFFSCDIFTDNNGVLRELVFPKALDLDRPKRARTTFSRDQLDRLESEFTANQYLVGRERSQLAKTLGLSETQVKVLPLKSGYHSSILHCFFLSPCLLFWSGVGQCTTGNEKEQVVLSHVAFAIDDR